jgi:spore maturation protein CgeB
VLTWHEAADVTLFHPPTAPTQRRGAVWIGNWGDGERSAELAEFLLRPAAEAALPLDIHGVRYPEDALRSLAAHGVRYRGWLANVAAPAVYARHLLTVHVPRRHYVRMLPGIPTIRVFEALACGIPLLSAPWRDSEGLFRPGQDFLFARDHDEMARHMRALQADDDLRRALAESGLATIRARHSCDHRAGELLAHLAHLGASAEQAA